MDNLSFNFNYDLAGAGYNSTYTMPAVTIVDDVTEEDAKDVPEVHLSAVSAPPVIPVAAPKEQRKYQEDAVKGVEKALVDGHKRIALVLPTGAGKTYSSRLVFQSDVVREQCGVAEGKPLRVLFAAHLDRLLIQAVSEYEGDDTVTIIPQSIYSDVSEAVLREGWDIVCIDEAHHEAMRTYQDQLEILGETPILGLTATPDRDDGRLIKFSAIVEPISRVEAVRQGFLAKSVVNTVVDESGHDKTEILTDVLNKFAHHMGRTLVFVATHAEAYAINDVLLSMGYRSIALTNQSKGEVNEILNRFSAGEIDFIVNCSKIDEGVDVKGCTDVVLGRQFGSRRLINQTIGRAARPDCPCNVWELVDPLETKYTAKDIIVELEDQHLVYFDHSAEQWIRESYDLDA